MKNRRSGARGPGFGLVCALALAGAAPVPAQDLREYANVVVEHDVAVPMRDGVALSATIVRPDAPGRFPTLVYRTPYGKDGYYRHAELPLKAARRGYVAVLVDVRGRYDAGGEFEAYRGEREDGYDTIEWAARLPFSDGRVGTYGGSYPGYVQWLALAEQPPGLVTAMPDATPVSSHHFFYQGGAFSPGWLEWFMPLILPDRRRRTNDSSGPWTYQAAFEAWERDRLPWYRYRPLADLPLLVRHAPYYYEWLAQPDSSAWWAFANVEDAFHRIRAPVYVASSWFDNAYGTVGATRGFNGVRSRAATPEARRHTKLLLGPWAHAAVTPKSTTWGELDFGPSAGMDWDAYLLRWFDQRLKGVDTGIDREPPVRIFVMGENRWRFEDEWPLARARDTAFYLHSNGRANSRRGDGALRLTVPGSQPPDRFVFDPAEPVWDPYFDEGGGAWNQEPVESREDVLVYTSDELSADVEVTGEIRAVLYVATDGRDTDFAVMVCDVHPDGTSYNVLGPDGGFLRLRYREGFGRQVLAEPGKVYRIEIGNMLTSNLFRRGHRIRVQITSSRLPHMDVNPNTGRAIATESELRRAAQTVYHDSDRPSHIVLPVIPRN